MDTLRGLLAQFEELGNQAGALNQTAVGLGKGGEQGEAPITGVRELAAHMHALSMRASELAGAAKQADFEELATRAHALYQQLLSAHHKLKLAVVGLAPELGVGDGTRAAPARAAAPASDRDRRACAAPSARGPGSPSAADCRSP